MEKQFQYAAKLSGAISQCFDEDSEYYIDQKELHEGDNLTHFFHALANITPNMYFSELTGEKMNNLEFNHIANQLCFQYSNQSDDKSEEG